MKKVKNILFVLFAFILAAYCIFCGASVKAAVSDSIMRCLTTVIPSLFAMMAVSGLILRSGAVSAVGKYFEPVGKIFGISGEMMCIFLFSMVAGYPIGGKMIYTKYTNGELEKSDAELLSGLCFGSGIPFIFGCVTANADAGRLILTSTALSQLILLGAIAPYFRRHFQCVENSRKTAFSAEILIDSVNGAGRGMADVCFCIIAFGVVTAMMRDFGITGMICGFLHHITGMPTETADAVTASLMDVTAVTAVGRCGVKWLPMAACAVSFGGLCVFLQIGGIFRGRLRMLPMIGMRAMAGLLSGVICRLLMPYFVDEAVTAAAISGRLSSCPSPVPSVILVIMTAAVIAKSHKNQPLHF